MGGFHGKPIYTPALNRVVREFRVQKIRSQGNSQKPVIHLFGFPLFDGKILAMKLNLALAQIATKLGDVDSNLDKHLEFIKQAKSQKADLVVFPELSLTGYVLQDLVASVAHTPTDGDPVFKHLLNESRDLDIVVGFVDEDSRHRFYIASAYLSGGRAIHVHHKVYLPTY